MKTDKYRRLFLEGAQEQMEILDRGLAALSRGEGEAALPEIRRAWHSLKGMSATMGYEDLAALAHAVEDHFRPSSRLEISPRLLAAVTDAVAGVGRFLGAMDSDTSPPDLSTLLHRFRTAAAAGDGAGAPAPEPGQETGPRLPPSIRVATGELDGLLAEVIDLEAVLAALQQAEEEDSEAGDTARRRAASHSAHDDLVLGRLRRGAERLHKRVARIRLVPFSLISPALHRVVADCAGRLGRSAVLEVSGEETRLDRGTLEALLNPLCHLLRNAVDHGLEAAKGSSDHREDEPGRIRLSLQNRGERLRVRVEDNGRGVDTARLAAMLEPDAPPLEDLERPGADLSPYLCRPGLSTARTATEVSGRGIGLDAVQQDLRRCGGRLTITSRPGSGTSVELLLPQKVSVTSCLLARAGGTAFGIPFSIIASVEGHPDPDPGDSVSLEDLLGGEPPPGSRSRTVAVRLARPGSSPRAVLVDALMGRLDAVVRPLLGSPPGSAYAGSALCGDGTPVAVLDTTALLDTPSPMVTLRDDGPPEPTGEEEAPPTDASPSSG
jgi:two-component system chemotaxis sensor kinase CheA